MSFTNREQFVSAQASEKIVLAQVEANARIYEWELHSGSIYKRITSYFTLALKENGTSLTNVSSLGAVVAGTFFYDVNTSTVYVRTTGSTDPELEEMIGTYQLFYASCNVAAPWDLVSGSEHVLYQGRITSNPGYKHKVGIEQSLTSLVGEGTLVLENTDGGLDTPFDTLIFENQLCRVYSWNRDLPYSDAKLIYRGRVTNKSFTPENVSFTIKDQIFDLDQKLPQNVFSDSDSVNDNIKGKVKRWVYGKVDGLLCQSVDQIGTGYQITGTVSGNSLSPIITGTGTLFLSEVSPGDVLTINEIEFDIESVDSDVQLTLGSTPQFSFLNFTATVVPEIPVTSKNREFFVADHATSRISRAIEQIVSLNRIKLSSTTGLFVGDYLEFESGERVAIRRIFNNFVTLNQNLLVAPTLSSLAVRHPIQGVFVEGKVVTPDNYTISNLGSPTFQTMITLSDDVEFTLARAVSLVANLTFTNGSRTITTVDDIDLRELLSPRDWIRPDDIAYTTYYEVLSVEPQSIELRVVFSDPNITDTAIVKRPDYIGDSTNVTVNLYGRTVTGEPEGLWIKTAAQAVHDVCSELDLTNFNEDSFNEVNETNAQILSLMIPTSNGTTLTSAKEAIDIINKSVYCSLTLDNNLNLKYKALKNDVPASPLVIRDNMVIDWKIKTTNGKNFRNSVVNYRFQDFNRFTKQAGNSVVTYTSDFVKNYIGTNQTNTFNCYLYDTSAVSIMSHRFVYFNRLGRSDMTIRSDLRLESVEIGDVIQVEFDRLYKRFGDTDTRKKLMMVIGLTKNGEDIIIEATDLGNSFNTSAVITPNDAQDFVSATSDEKLKYGYITSADGIVNEEEQTANINLIS